MWGEYGPGNIFLPGYTCKHCVSKSLGIAPNILDFCALVSVNLPRGGTKQMHTCLDMMEKGEIYSQIWGLCHLQGATMFMALMPFPSPVLGSQHPFMLPGVSLELRGASRVLTYGPVPVGTFSWCFPSLGYQRCHSMPRCPTKSGPSMAPLCLAHQSKF